MSILHFLATWYRQLHGEGLRTRPTIREDGVFLAALPSSTWKTAWCPARFLSIRRTSVSGDGAGNPYKTISSAALVAKAGDTVMVYSGTYREQVQPAIPARNRPITTPTGASVTVTAYGFYVSNRSWISIHGFVVTQTSSNGIRIANSSNITIDSNDVGCTGNIRQWQDFSRHLCQQFHERSAVGQPRTRTIPMPQSPDQRRNGDSVIGNLTYQNAQGYTRAAPGIKCAAAETSSKTTSAMTMKTAASSSITGPTTIWWPTTSATITATTASTIVGFYRDTDHRQ